MQDIQFDTSLHLIHTWYKILYQTRELLPFTLRFKVKNKKIGIINQWPQIIKFIP